MLVSKITGKSKSLYKHNASTELKMPHQYIGLEIELEGCTPNYAYPDNFHQYWAMKDDSSLRNEGNKIGIEYVFREALFGEDVIDAISVFERAMNEMGPTPSWRCGLHVHLDTSDLTTDALFNFVFLYMVYESALYNYLGEDRAQSPFCVPLASYTDSSERLVQMLQYLKSTYSEDEKRLRLYKAFESWNKYNGMNLAPLVRFGTIEFRQAPSTYNARKIKEWLNLLLSLKSAAQSIDAKFTTEFHRYISQTGVTQLSRYVFGDLLDNVLYSTFYDDVQSNIKFVQHIIVSMQKDTIKDKVRRRAPKLGLSERMQSLTKSPDTPKTKFETGAELLEQEQQRAIRRALRPRMNVPRPDTFNPDEEGQF